MSESDAPSDASPTDDAPSDTLVRVSAADDTIRAVAAVTTVVRYEAFVASPEAETRRLCEALGLAFHPPMLRYADSPVFIDLPSITSQFELAAGGIDPGPSGRT